MAQVPDRGEPGSSGELDFSYLFQLLEDEGYQGFVGCEYRPQGEAPGSLGKGSLEGRMLDGGAVLSLCVEMALSLFHCRRHGGGSELATLILGQTGPPTEWPVGFDRHLHAALGQQVRFPRGSSELKTHWAFSCVYYRGRGHTVSNASMSLS